ncbi:MAG: CapA family protein [Bacteroides sp.]|nr:CapA family protein [Roseburia sp.]MCM1347102.1 CapA family protein [Bacteroides sp.]MCM1420717.1 CapA family protein [Bacteroides sp.]
MIRYIIVVMLAIFSCCCVWAQRVSKLVFTGEVNFGTNYRRKAPQNIEYDRQYDFAKEIFASASATFTTLGTVLMDVDGTPNKSNMNGMERLMRMPEWYARVLSGAGFTGVSLVDKHVADFGIEGLTSTTNAMRDNHLRFAGIKSLHEYEIFERRGMKYGFAAFGTAVHASDMRDTVDIKRVVSMLDKECDIVVVAFSFRPQGFHINSIDGRGHVNTPYLSDAEVFARFCIDAGADIVYGNGDGNVHPMDLYKDRLIIYGMGRFCAPYVPSVSGEKKYAPVVEVSVFDDGTFKEGFVHSFRRTEQQSRLVLDAGKEAVKRMKVQTERDFPSSDLFISNEGEIHAKSQSARALALKLVNEAEKHQGKRYRGGAMGPMVFDCSGFTSYVYLQLGIKLKRSSRDQYTEGVAVDKDNLMPGDLVFFKGSAASRTIGHVGMVVSVDKEGRTFKFIHASPSRGIVIDDFSRMAYYIKRYVGARRILN